MKSFTPLIVIPARLASARLPDKPLAMIGDIPMIVHCLHRAEEAKIAEVVVAAADTEIVDVVTRHGGRAILSDPDLPSGSDRVAAVVQEIDPKRNYSHIINFQGDLPLFAPQDLRYLLNRWESSAVRTLVTRITDPAEIASDAVVKAQTGFSEETTGAVARAIGFSRAAVPWGEGSYWHHVGVYGYPRHVLEEFVALPPSPLEQREKLEQLRLLENGYAIEAVIIAEPAIGVDTPEDLALVRELWQNRK